MRLDGRVALITGGGSGIGRATAALFAEEGARVVITGRRGGRLEAVAREIREDGGRIESMPADVTDERSARAAVSKTLDAFGALDILVNNAGYAPDWTPVHETSDEEWKRVQEVNINGAFRMARAALPHLIERRGAIVNVASISAIKASNSVASYSVAKAGLLALTRCIAAEYGWQGVRCNCVVPSWVQTPMTEAFLADEDSRRDIARRHALQRIATPREVARAVLYLAGPDSTFVTGVAHPVDGGMSVL